MNDMLKKLGLTRLFTRLHHKVDQSFSQSPLPTTNDFAVATANATPSDHATHGAINETTQGANMSSDKFYKKIKNVLKLKNSKLLFSVITGLIIITIASLAISNLTKSQSKTNVAGTNDQKIEIKNAKSTQLLNKEFLFPLKDAAGKEISKIKYTIQDAQLRDEIIVKGQKATAIKGRTFLIINLKITNNYNKSIQLNARDYIRLIANNSSEKLAPDIHNDPVEIQAISTKFTRLGFPINETDNNLTLQVGEIDGKKELIKLDLK